MQYWQDLKNHKTIKILKFPLTLITFRQKLVETCHMLHTSYKVDNIKDFFQQLQHQMGA